MKKFLLRLSILLALAFVAQYVVYFALKTGLDKKSKFRLTRYFRSSKHAYFVIGNSRGVNSINEKYAVKTLKADIINLSFNGQPYANALNILDDVNSRNKNSTIFFEITCINNNYIDDSYSYYYTNSKIIKKRYSGTIYNWLTLLRLNNELFLRNIYYLNKSDNDWINRNTITPNIINHLKTDSAYTIFLNKAVFMQRLAELQKRCDEHSNKLIYFLAPYYPDYLSKITDYNDIINYMNVNKAKYKFADLNTVKLANYMFADRVHTNDRGATVLTENLINLSNKD